MKRVLGRYLLCLVPFLIFAGHGAVCAYRFIRQLPAGDNSWREPEVLLYLTNTSVLIGAVMSTVLFITMALNDVWLIVAKRLEKRRMAKFMNE